MELIQSFCNKPHYKNFNKIKKLHKELFYYYSEKSLQQNIGFVNLAQKIITYKSLNSLVSNQLSHEYSCKKLDLPNANVWYCENFFENPKKWYDLIDQTINWKDFPVRVFGKIFNQPRKNFYMADSNHPYKYSGFERTPEPWSEPMIEMKTFIQNLANKIDPKQPKLTACLGNKYRDGNDYIGAHSDDEKDLKNNSFIMSVSLGAARDFVFINKKTKKRTSINLKSGSVVIMGPGTQQNYKHEVPKRKGVKLPRINLTFRSVIFSC